MSWKEGARRQSRRGTPACAMAPTARLKQAIDVGPRRCPLFEPEHGGRSRSLGHSPADSFETPHHRPHGRGRRAATT